MVVVVLVVTLVTASTVASGNAAAAIQMGLEQTNARVFDILVGQRTTMLKLTQQYANNPDFRSALGRSQHTSDTTTAFASLFDLTTEADTAVDATRTQIVGPDGVLLARSDNPSAHGNSLEGALVVGALEGHQTQGFGVVDSVRGWWRFPFQRGQSLLGALVACQIDDTLATRIDDRRAASWFFTASSLTPLVSVSQPGRQQRWRRPIERDDLGRRRAPSLAATRARPSCPSATSTRSRSVACTTWGRVIASSASNQIAGYALQIATRSS